VGGVDHLGAEDVGDAQGLDPVLAGALDLDQGQFALDTERIAADVLDAAYADGLFRLGADVGQDGGRPGGDDG
jgi:hypothetical protein